MAGGRRRRCGRRGAADGGTPPRDPRDAATAVTARAPLRRGARLIAAARQRRRRRAARASTSSPGLAASVKAMRRWEPQRLKENPVVHRVSRGALKQTKFNQTFILNATV